MPSSEVFNSDTCFNLSPRSLLLPQPNRFIIKSVIMPKEALRKKWEENKWKAITEV